MPNKTPTEITQSFSSITHSVWKLADGQDGQPDERIEFNLQGTPVTFMVSGIMWNIMKTINNTFENIGLGVYLSYNSNVSKARQERGEGQRTLRMVLQGYSNKSLTIGRLIMSPPPDTSVRTGEAGRGVLLHFNLRIDTKGRAIEDTRELLYSILKKALAKSAIDLSEIEALIQDLKAQFQNLDALKVLYEADYSIELLAEEMANQGEEV